MSSVNADAATGEFSARQAPSEPLQTTGHQPGKLVGNEAAPEFHVQTLPAGTAPADRTFKPNNADEVTPQARFTDNVDPDSKQELPNAADTITGSTSADVHTGIGHPGSGQASSEQHGAVDKKGGLEARGATANAANLVDKRDPNFADQRLGGSENATLKNELGGAPAQELEPEKST